MPICIRIRPPIALLLRVTLLAPCAAGWLSAAEPLDDAYRRAPTRAFWHAVGVAIQQAHDCDLPATEMRNTVAFQRLQQYFLARYAEISEPGADVASPEDVADAFEEGRNAQRARLPPSNDECVGIRKGWAIREARAAGILSRASGATQAADGEPNAPGER